MFVAVLHTRQRLLPLKSIRAQRMEESEMTMSSPSQQTEYATFETTDDPKFRYPHFGRLSRCVLLKSPSKVQIVAGSRQACRS